MRRLFATSTGALFLLSLSAGLQAQDKNAKQVEVDPARKKAQAVEAAIVETAEQFVEAFNKKDADAVAALFAEKAEYIDADGASVEGRKAIGELFQRGFEASPETQIAMFVDRVRTVGDKIAIEDGYSIVSRPGGVPSRARYTVIHVREGRAWKIHRVEENQAGDPTPNERLQQLTWMLGSWIDERPDSVISTNCYWGEGGSYLIRSFEIRSEGEVVQAGTSRVGWDPLHKQFRSWVFDSDGGYATGLWTQVDSRWIIKMQGVLSDGSTASSTRGPCAERGRRRGRRRRAGAPPVAAARTRRVRAPRTAAPRSCRASRAAAARRATGRRRSCES